MCKAKKILILMLLGLISFPALANEVVDGDEEDDSDLIQRLVQQAPVPTPRPAPRVTPVRSTPRRAAPARVERTDDEDYATDFDDQVQETGYVDRNLTGLLSRVSSQAWKQATRSRRVANFCGGGYRSGNRSKCMCAAGVADALLASGVCTTRPSSNALQMHTNGVLRRACPRLNLSNSRDPGRAPAGSVIVYAGHAGRRVHNFGHVEIKVPVTRELLQTMGRAGAGLREGGFMYCSDYCSPRPTLTRTNRVAAIYNLR
ncbi:MAG: hypothetical protein K2Q26_08240 [Bdellovibrionales bacterium]|nr:hypothetical protein [Bdellovibrionales bacterium]